MADDKVNYKQKHSGTGDAQVKYGHIHYDQTKSAYMIRSGHDLRHNIILDADGDNKFRAGSTQINCPGTFNVVAGDDVAFDLPGVFLRAENGDIIISAPNGRIRMEARNIDVIASASGTTNGVINLDAKEQVIINSNVISIDAKSTLKLEATRTLDVIGNSVLNLYGGFIVAADGATKIKGSKPIASIHLFEFLNRLRGVVDILS